ncbi:MAG: nucleotidyltransferase family protein [Acidobacteriia bacterium]|nr:nucleotidyltransferase family protein [Terriglobia bacterium]
MITDLTPFCIGPDATLIDAMRLIDRNAKGIALVVDARQHLLYTVTDGDLRRAILHGLSLDMTLAAWAATRPEFGNSRPRSVPVGTSYERIREMLEPEGLRHMPVVDDDGRVIGLVVLTGPRRDADAAVHAVVMAGGRGSRLSPLTAETPKPLLPVGDRPLMEHLVGQLKDAGIERLSVTTHYRGDQIRSHFGDGRRFGLEIEYVNEDQPLGTAGGLGLLAPWSSTLLVVNGDILTRVNYQSMLSFHRENRAAMTVGVRQYKIPVAYGIVETDGVEIRAINEKPTLQFFSNAGLYVMEPCVREYLTPARRIDMPDLISALVAGGHKVVSFPISEYWLDIGRHEDYRQAQVDVKEGH